MAAFLSAPLLYAGATLLRNAYFRLPLGRIANVANQPDQAVIAGVRLETAQESMKQPDQTKASDSKRLSATISPKSDVKKQQLKLEDRQSPEQKLKRRRDDSPEADKATKVQRSKVSSVKKSILIDCEATTHSITDNCKSDPFGRSRSSKGSAATVPVLSMPAPVPSESKPKARKTDVQEPLAALTTSTAPFSEKSSEVVQTSKPTRSRKSSPAATSEPSQPVLPAVESLNPKSENLLAASVKNEVEAGDQECPFLHRAVRGLSVSRHRAMLR